MEVPFRPFVQEAADVFKMTTPCLFVFTIYLSREMVCDIQDVEGDRAGHVWTLPVLFGECIDIKLAGIHPFAHCQL